MPHRCRDPFEFLILSAFTIARQQNPGRAPRGTYPRAVPSFRSAVATSYRQGRPQAAVSVDIGK